MAVKATTKWLTACLYYNEPWEEFLIQAVKPYIDVVMQTGVAECFYFQRSWDGGPHIRIWFKGNAFILDQMLRPNLQEHFLQYFESRPSASPASEHLAGKSGELKRFPNNSIQYFNVAPKFEFPGCPPELACREKQFQASSGLVLKTLKEKSGRWNYDEMVSTAVKFHLGFAYAVGMRLDETQQFFQWMTESWVKRNEKRAREAGQFFNSDSSLRFFHQLFDMQRKDIVPYHAALWELFKNYRKIADEQFIHWFHTSSNTSLELNLAVHEGNLRPDMQNIDEAYHVNTHLGLWNYFAAFVRLLDNQLGIHHQNEGYLFYVITQSLRAVQNGVPAYARVAF